MEPTSVALAMEWSIQLEMGLRSTKPGQLILLFVKYFLSLCSILFHWNFGNPNNGNPQIIAPFHCVPLIHTKSYS